MSILIDDRSGSAELESYLRPHGTIQRLGLNAEELLAPKPPEEEER